MASPSNDVPYCLLPSCKTLETFDEQFRRKCPKNPIFDTSSPLIPGLRFFFQNPSHVTFFTWSTPNFMQSFRKNYRAVSEIFKDRHTDGQTQGPQRRLLRTPSTKPGVQRDIWKELLNANKTKYTVDPWVYFLMEASE